MAFAQALLERVVQLLPGQARFAVVEVAAHDGLVDLDDLVDDVLVRGGGRREIRLTARFEKAIDHRAAPLRGQIDWQALVAELVAQRFGDTFEVDAVVVDLVDDQDAAQVALFGAFHQPPGRVRDADHRVDDDRAGFHGGHRGQGRTAEVRIAGCVDQIDMDVADVDRRDCRGHRMAAFLFHRIVVRHGRAAFDGACRLDCAAGMQQGFEQGGFAGARMTCECDIADAIGAVRHDLGLPAVLVGEAVMLILAASKPKDRRATGTVMAVPRVPDGAADASTRIDLSFSRGRVKRQERAVERRTALAGASANSDKTAGLPFFTAKLPSRRSAKDALACIWPVGRAPERGEPRVMVRLFRHCLKGISACVAPTKAARAPGMI